MRRPGGTGQIEVLKSGKARIRLGVGGKRRDFGTFESEAEAREVLPEIVKQIQTGNFKPLTGTTVEAFARQWLDRKEKERGAPDLPRRGALKHIERAPFASRRLSQVSRGDVVRWAGELATAKSTVTGAPLSPATRRLIFSTLACVFQQAIDEERVTVNPATRIRVPNKVGADEPWTFLDPAQQARLLNYPGLPPELLLPIKFAMGTGLRSGEQWALEVRDVHLGKDPHIVVRYGGRNHRQTKGRRVRTVPLFGYALEAAKAWLVLLPKFAPHNPLRLMFPTATGAMRRRDHPLGRVRRDGKRIDIWKEVVARVFGASFELRWHDLRHTCGSSLISGWWGKAWRIEQVRDILGHSSVKLTERYAHLTPGDLQAVARETGARSPREAHALQTPAKQALLSEPEHEDIVSDRPPGSGTYTDSWASLGLRERVAATLKAVSRKEGVDEAVLDDLSIAILREVVAAHPVAGPALKAIETSGAFKVDRFVEVAAEYLATAPASRKERAS